MKKTPFSRLSQLGSLAAKVAGSAVVSGIDRVTKGKDLAQRLLHEKTARELLGVLGDMKGLPMKVGQLLSYMDGVIPSPYQEVYRDVLANLQVQAKPLSWSLMQPFLERELGQNPEDVFVSFEKQPIAAASIGQVYEARLKDGRRVAVKEQYPGIAEALESDLKVVQNAFGILTSVLPKFDARQMADDFMARVSEECDYLKEAATQRRFRELWLDDARIVVPDVIEEWCRPRVLVTSLERGLSFQQFAARASLVERNRMGELLFEVTARSVLEHGLFNADPHPGNFLFPGDGRMVLLDFGCVQSYDEETRRAFHDVCEAVLDGKRDAELWASVAHALQIDPEQPEGFRQLVEEHLIFGFHPVLGKQPFKYTAAYTERFTDLTMQAKIYFLKNFLRQGVPGPKRPGFVFLNRVLFGLNSLLASLRSQADWRSLMKTVLDRSAASSD